MRPSAWMGADTVAGSIRGRVRSFPGAVERRVAAGVERRSSVRGASIGDREMTFVGPRVIGAGTLRILEQNAVPALKKVQRFILKTVDATSVKTAHKQAKNPATERLQPAKVVETTTICTSGTITAYRPRHK